MLGVIRCGCRKNGRFEMLIDLAKWASRFPLNHVKGEDFSAFGPVIKGCEP